MPNPKSRDMLGDLGERYHAYREQFMLSESIGLTQLYNRFHDPSDKDPRIETVRVLHREIDLAVARAYGWDDLDLEHGYYEVPYLPENDRVRFTISDRSRLEVLRRLSELNHRRYEDEVAQGLHGNGGKRASTHAPRAVRGTSAAPTQPSFDFETVAATITDGVAAASAILDFLNAHDGWHAKADVLAATDITDGLWNSAINGLIADGRVERQGERRGARYRVQPGVAP